MSKKSLGTKSKIIKRYKTLNNIKDIEDQPRISNIHLMRFPKKRREKIQGRKYYELKATDLNIEVSSEDMRRFESF